MKGRFLFLLLLIWPLLGCQPLEGSPATGPTPEEVTLPQPNLKGRLSLEEVLAKRRSVRQFREEELTWEEISQLLWAGQGITDPKGFRTAPSAGALYPLELYLATAEGSYHYLPDGHKLKKVAEGDGRGRLGEAGLKQGALGEAPAIIVIAAVYERTEAKYGSRAQRYVHLEAGHAAQNILLQATALGLGAVPIGAFDDQEVKEALPLPSDHEPLYLIPVGHPE